MSNSRSPIGVNSDGAAAAATTAAVAVDRRSSKHRRSGSIFDTGESLKLRQERARMARAGRKQSLEEVHRQMIQNVSFALSIDAAVVEEFIVDRQENIELMDDFFREDGRRCIMFYYQLMEIPGLDCGRTFPGVPKKGKFLQVAAMDGTTDGLLTLCVFPASQERD